MATHQYIEPPIESLRLSLRYDPETGELRKFPSGELCKLRYANYGSKVYFYGLWLLVHRVGWALTHNAWPKGELIHLNDKIYDNRLANLKEVIPWVTPEGAPDARYKALIRDIMRSGIKQDRIDRRKCRNNFKGHLKGAYPAPGGWIAQISVKGETRYLGTFATAEDAHQAYLKAVKFYRPAPHAA